VVRLDCTKERGNACGGRKRSAQSNEGNRGTPGGDARKQENSASAERGVDCEARNRAGDEDDESPPMKNPVDRCQRGRSQEDVRRVSRRAPNAIRKSAGKLNRIAETTKKSASYNPLGQNSFKGTGGKQASQKGRSKMTRSVPKNRSRQSGRSRENRRKKANRIGGGRTHYS